MNAQLHAIAESISVNTFRLIKPATPIRIFIIKIWAKYSLESAATTNTSINFVRAFELYDGHEGHI